MTTLLTHAACGGAPVLYENAKHSVAVQVPARARVDSVSEGSARPDICKDTTFQVTWMDGRFRLLSVAKSPFGFVLFTCRLRVSLGAGELLEIEKSSFAAKGGLAKDTGPGAIEVSAAGSWARLVIKVAQGRQVTAMVTSQERDDLWGSEATAFLETARPTAGGAVK